MKKCMTMLLALFLFSSVGVYAHQNILLGIVNECDNVDATIYKADEYVPGIKEEWEAAKEEREQLKDSLRELKVKKWEENAEKREQEREAMDYEKQELRDKLQNGEMTTEEYKDSLREVTHKYDKERLRKNRSWTKKLNKDKKKILKCKDEMQGYYNQLVKAVRDEDEKNIEKSFNKFLKSYLATNDIIKNRIEKFE